MGGTYSDTDPKDLFISLEELKNQPNEKIQYSGIVITQKEQQEKKQIIDNTIQKNEIRQQSLIKKPQQNDEPKILKTSFIKIQEITQQEIEEKKKSQLGNQSLIKLNKEVQNYFPDWMAEKFEKFGKYKPPIPPERISQGVHNLDHNQYFQGTFINGKKEGYGILLSQEELYEGYFQNDLRFGWGRSLQKDKVKQGVWEGFIIVQKLVEKTDSYHYEERDDGLSYYEDETIIYLGQYKNGQRNGRGELKFKSIPDRYVGQFKDNEIHGKGTYYFHSGIIHEGQFIQGQITGQGLRKYPDGREYRGDFVNGRKEGNGILKEVQDGGQISIYNGQFKNNKKHGQGAITINDLQLVGFWLDDVLQNDNNENE